MVTKRKGAQPEAQTAKRVLSCQAVTLQAFSKRISILTKNEKSQPFTSVIHHHTLLGKWVLKSAWGSHAFWSLSNSWKVPKKRTVLAGNWSWMFPANTVKYKDRKFTDFWAPAEFFQEIINPRLIKQSPVMSKRRQEMGLIWPFKKPPKKVNYLLNWSCLSKSNFHGIAKFCEPARHTPMQTCKCALEDKGSPGDFKLKRTSFLLSLQVVSSLLVWIVLFRCEIKVHSVWCFLFREREEKHCRLWWGFLMASIKVQANPTLPTNDIFRGLWFLSAEGTLILRRYENINLSV